MVIVASIASANVMSAAVGAAWPELPPTVLELIVELVLAALAVVLLTAMRSWTTVGFRALPRLSDLRLYWIPLLPVLPVVVSASVGMSRLRFEEVLFFVILACLIGFVEEAFFRGLLLQALAPRGLWKAAVLSSIIFGVLHLLNLLFGADPAATLIQTVYATAMGFGFAAVTLRTGSLWPLVAIHAAIDFAGFVTSQGTVIGSVTSTDIAIYSLYIVMFGGYGILMMRAVTRESAQAGPTKTPSDNSPASTRSAT
jgi:hypothetical protein